MDIVFTTVTSLGVSICEGPLKSIKTLPVECVAKDSIKDVIMKKDQSPLK